ncbi:shikimate dehydrogenase family protein [Pseudomonas monteilii]|uniref:shikimate dehydrogenase (NADP(+)) n=1 Tax=Pseudomonas monteilii TaxID=76759 RepID=A0AAP7KIC0_9PSED|nr:MULTISPECIES: shikimate dehydrogenase [Pseudomonas]MCV4076474.1 shikimate dehydrogenase [Pseudomonas aeruginosa]OAH57069.1 shikimate dehydrogenase [Pseudomonas monteilii]
MENTNKVSGTTRVYAIIADPIHHVQTPAAMNRLFSERGDDRVMVPFHVSTKDLQSVVAGLRGIQSLDGFIVTVPHKTAIVELCDSISDAARLVGAVNVVRRSENGSLHGDILDGEGFLAGLRQRGVEPLGMSVYLAGAGGAAKAIAFSLAAAGVSKITIFNRTACKAEELTRRLSTVFPTLELSVGSYDPSGHDLVVNSTSLGLSADDILPLDVTLLTPSQIVAEIIMKPAITPLLAAATEKGCRVLDGMPMLLCQIELMAAAMATNKNERNHEHI